MARKWLTLLVVLKSTTLLTQRAPEMKFSEEAPTLGTEELRSLEAWSNLYPIILKAGRTSHLKPIGLDEEAAEAELA